MLDYTVERGKRKTVCIHITGDGRVVVKAPFFVSSSRIRQFVSEKESLIKRKLEKTEMSRSLAEEMGGKLSPEEIKELIKRAKETVPERVEHYASIIGVRYGRITVRAQKTRWGSCNSKGDLSFNLLLMLAPPEVLDSVVVHELCHLKEMNHSERFYGEILKVFPEYRKWNGWLKKNGEALVMLLP